MRDVTQQDGNDARQCLSKVSKQCVTDEPPCVKKKKTALNDFQAAQITWLEHMKGLELMLLIQRFSGMFIVVEY
jgi:hypothetical protein